jgi:PAS domain S-box-containing protein
MTVRLPHVLYVGRGANERGRVVRELHGAFDGATVSTVSDAATAVEQHPRGPPVDCIVLGAGATSAAELASLAEPCAGRGPVPVVVCGGPEAAAAARDASGVVVAASIQADRNEPHRTLASRVREVLARAVDSDSPTDRSNESRSDGRSAAADGPAGGRIDSDGPGRRCRLLVEQSDEAMAVVEGGRYRLVNDACVDLIGYPRDRILGSTDEDLFPASVAAELRRHAEQAAEDERSCEHRIEVEVDGEPRVLDVTHLPADRGNDGPVTTGRIASDVTEQVERERLLREERDRLESLASAVAHDARNALQVIIGRTALAEESLPPEPTAPERISNRSASVSTGSTTSSPPWSRSTA